MARQRMVGVCIVGFACLCLFSAEFVFAQSQSVSKTSQPEKGRNAQEDQIREAIFRYRIGSTKSANPVFLSIEGKDPSEDFMARFSHSQVPVKKASASYYEKEPFPGWLRDRSTGRKGVHLSVDSIRWISNDHVEVNGGYYCGGLCANAGTYFVTKKNGRWVVEKYEVHMVS